MRYFLSRLSMRSGYNCTSCINACPLFIFINIFLSYFDFCFFLVPITFHNQIDHLDEDFKNNIIGNIFTDICYLGDIFSFFRIGWCLASWPQDIYFLNQPYWLNIQYITPFPLSHKDMTNQISNEWVPLQNTRKMRNLSKTSKLSCFH